MTQRRAPTTDRLPTANCLLPTRPQGARPGSVLITAVMVLLVLVGLVAALAPVVRLDVRAAGDEGDRLQARCLARAGVQLALTALEQDDASVDGPQDVWATLGTGGEDQFPLGNGHFR